MKRYLLVVFLVGFCAVSWIFTIKTYSSGSKEFDDLMAAARVSYDKKIYDEAEENYKKALQNRPKSQEALFGLAETYFSMEKYENAVTTCERILEENSENEKAAILEAKSLISGGKYSKSINILSKVEQTDEVKHMILDAKGKYTLRYYKVVFPKNIDVCAPPGLHLSVLQENEKAVAYTSKGTKYAHGEVTYLGPISEDGELFPAVQDGVWCYVDKDGSRKLVPDKEYEFLGPFSSGFAVAKRDGVFGFIDMSFNEHSFGLENAYNFVGDTAIIKENGVIKIVDKEFSIVKETDYTGVVADEYGYTNHLGISVFIKNDLYYLCDSSGESIGGFSADYIGLPAEANSDNKKSGGFLVEYKSEDKFGFVNSKNGKIVIKPKYDDAKAFSQGLAPIKVGEKWGFIDEKGTEIVTPTFNFATTVSERGSAWIKNEAGYALLTFYYLSE